MKVSRLGLLILQKHHTKSQSGDDFAVFMVGVAVNNEIRLEFGVKIGVSQKCRVVRRDYLGYLWVFSGVEVKSDILTDRS
jgi:hypothetical protein